MFLDKSSFLYYLITIWFRNVFINLIFNYFTYSFIFLFFLRFLIPVMSSFISSNPLIDFPPSIAAPVPRAPPITIPVVPADFSTFTSLLLLSFFFLFSLEENSFHKIIITLFFLIFSFLGL